MEIIFYMFLLLICEIIVYCLVLGLDWYFKSKKCKLVKKSKLMFNSKNGSKDKISLVAYLFQIFNYIYILIYFLVAFIETFIYRSRILLNINFFSVIIYFGVSLISLIIFAFLSILEDKEL